jgi:hypothetical protein
MTGSDFASPHATPSPNLAAVDQQIDQIRKKLHQLQQIDVPHDERVRRLLEMRLAVLEARLLYPTDDVLEQLERTLDERVSRVSLWIDRRGSSPDMP